MIQTRHKTKKQFDAFIRLMNEDFEVLDQDEIKALEDYVVIKTYQKNEIIFGEGTIASKLYFIVDGCVRLFYNVGGQDRTTFFYSKGEFLWAGKSYNYKIPAKQNYQALEESTIVIFDGSTTENLFRIFPKFEHIGRICAENELLKCQQLITSFVALSPEERYVELLESSTDLFQRVPQKYIASYLGISAETLSRIKRRVIQKIRNKRLAGFHALAS